LVESNSRGSDGEGCPDESEEPEPLVSQCVVDFADVEVRLRSTWSIGWQAGLDEYLLTVGEELCRVGNYVCTSRSARGAMDSRGSNHGDLQSGSRKTTATPNTMVTRPSKRKRYCHPLKPCEPDIVSKAYANSPLKTPERLPRTSVGGQYAALTGSLFAYSTHRNTVTASTARQAYTNM
jgi:hypothetical protein